MTAKIAALLATTAVASVALAAPATADEASYLASLRNRGVYGVSTSTALEVGHFYCSQLRQGRRYNAVYSDILDYVGIRLGQPHGTVGNLMGAAWNNLCPEFGKLARSTDLEYIAPRYR
ncbi:hypothetical protein AU195_06805 [Mycobacterium sp. IS-1496]|uniref:DUF732 domain-containing protein n=1 Tax=Mycobacterium sp. IS-1496 TaxID=1772284 RepID=UPI000741761F|nr:DUF732 domain-containing protein [Mycobacterium sp. IS-1496]KUI22006.1 hypothetical protein AU195_06805 [Mycobacterium sp. IS-1496]